MESIYTYAKLYQAYLDCRKNKRKTVNALRFEIDFEANLRGLLAELQSHAYRPGRSICFVVTEPTPREIFAADFRDRIVHHLFVSELLPVAERSFIFDSYACRLDKGTHRAVARLHRFLAKLSRTGSRQPWFMKIDISGFFMSIDKEILYGLVLDLIDKAGKDDRWQTELAHLAEVIIFYEPGSNYSVKGDKNLFALIPARKSLFCQPAGQGLPIGNYSSQFFANVYLNPLDQYVKRTLKCRHYLRYVDDLVLLASDPAVLTVWLAQISAFVRQVLLLSVNRRKTVIQPVERGIDFLGYYVRPACIHPRRTVTRRYKNKLFRAALGLSPLPWPKTLAIAHSYQGHSRYF